MPPVQFRSVGRHRRPSSSRLPRLAATAAVSGALVFAGGIPADASTSISASAASHEPRIHYNSRGHAVTLVQQRLGVTPTGWFGPITRSAVTRFQHRHALPATGVVDRRTWLALAGQRTLHKATAAPSSKAAAQPASKAQTRAATNRAAHRSSRSADRSADRAQLADQVLAEAARHEGKPYQYGATGPGSFDCSGFTGYVFRQVGISLPRTSREQRAAVPRVSADDARPGDLMFSHDSAGRVFHVAIYAGNGKIWDSPRSGETVGKRKIWSNNYSFGRIN